jgi:hypothetical protein
MRQFIVRAGSACPLFAKLATFGLALAFIFSCSSGTGGGGSIHQKEFAMKTIHLFLLLALFASAFAQDNALAQDNRDKNISIGGSIGYVRAVLDDFKDYPFEGFGFSFGALGFIPLTDVAKFGGDISIGYITASAKNEYDVKITISEFSLNLSPKIRFGQEKTYADISLGMSIPLSSEVILKVPGYRTETHKITDSETDFLLSLAGRYNVIGFAIGKILTGSDRATELSASAFIPITEQLEIVPSISYSTGDLGNELRLIIGFDYFL